MKESGLVGVPGCRTFVVGCLTVRSTPPRPMSHGEVDSPRPRESLGWLRGVGTTRGSDGCLDVQSVAKSKSVNVTVAIVEFSQNYKHNVSSDRAVVLPSL